PFEACNRANQYDVWCTVTEEQLAQNWENISLVFVIDDETIPLDNFVEFDDDIGGELACRARYVLLTDWPRGAYLLTVEVTFAAELDDGFEVYPAGTHVYEYSVSVEE
ncbi:MAG: hypothetical protein IIA44_07055, partial [Acidobacteria bacterium]|nr:hypothetical protein [Acidobacteriota bacterium]